MNLDESFCEKIEKGVPYITRRPLGQSPKDANSALSECHSALQKCRIGSWTSNTPSCSGAVWTPLLMFFDRLWFLTVRHLGMFSSSVKKLLGYKTLQHTNAAASSRERWTRVYVFGHNMLVKNFCIKLYQLWRLLK